jgi:hypothetical protein
VLYRGWGWNVSVWSGRILKQESYVWWASLGEAVASLLWNLYLLATHNQQWEVPYTFRFVTTSFNFHLTPGEQKCNWLKRSEAEKVLFLSCSSSHGSTDEYLRLVFLLGWLPLPARLRPNQEHCDRQPGLRPDLLGRSLHVRALARTDIPVSKTGLNEAMLWHWTVRKGTYVVHCVIGYRSVNWTHRFLRFQCQEGIGLQPSRNSCNRVAAEVEANFFEEGESGITPVSNKN